MASARQEGTRDFPALGMWLRLKVWSLRFRLSMQGSGEAMSLEEYELENEESVEYRAGRGKPRKTK